MAPTVWIVRYLWLIPALPIVAAGMGALLKQRQRKFAATLAIGAMSISFVLAVVAFAHLLLTPARLFVNIPWMQFGNEWVRLGWVLDPLAAVMLVMVTFVGLLIFIYSVGYMHHDENFTRFFCFLSLFAGAMLGVLIANSLLLLFMCWEVVGLTSYLLIGFWYERPAAAAAAKKAFITTRIGDLGLLLGMVWLYGQTGTLLFYDNGAGCMEHTAVSLLATQTVGFGMAASTAIALLIFCGAVGKSGQLPLHVWLPDAMEGPTPVSALIHAATMVAAGVYLVARVYPLMSAPTSASQSQGGALEVVAWVGALTAIFAALVAVAQDDIKKVLAYSTVSQLGYMFMACGVGAFSAGVFHLMTHAFFKGLLFLAAGSVIHAVGGEQDMRKMGGLRSYIPVTFATMLIATLAIAGIPPFAGFWSKDEILWKAFSSEHGSWVFWLIGVITAFITSFYMFRLLFMTFFGDYRGAKVDDHGHAHATDAHSGHGHGEPHESPMVMLAPLVILALLSVFGGLVGYHNAFEHFLEPVFGSGATAEAAGEVSTSGTEWLLMGISVLVAFSGAGLAWFLYISKPYLPQKIADGLGSFYTTVVNKYYVDELYAKLFVKPLIDGSTSILWQGVDRKVIDDTVNNAADGARHVSDEVRHMQSGNLRSYAGWIAAGSAVVIAYMIWLGVR